MNSLPKKPANLIYDVNERPPLWTNLLLGLQHVMVISVGWIFVVVIVTAIGGTFAETGNVIRICMIASGTATILQALNKGPVGSGYLCPFSNGPAYIPASILAGQTGGLSLIFIFTSISGIFEGILSRILPRLRVMFPPEVTGLVVMMVGIQLITLGCPRFMGYTKSGAAPDNTSIIIASITLSAMIIPTVWGKGKLRLYPVLIGLAAGYLTAFTAGLINMAQLQTTLEVPLLSVPDIAFGQWAFDPFLLPVFLIASLASTLKAVGDLTLCQKINDTEWKRTDMKSVSGGVLAQSICNTAAGILGGMGQSTFSSNIGLSLATGATSRSIALPCGLILIALAFLPKLAAVFTIMPQPVMGAMLIYVASFMILAGIQVLISRMLDSRKIFVIGISMIFGLSVDMVPGLYSGVPPAFQSIFSSSLALTTILVIILNLVFRIGITKKQTLELTPGSGNSRTIYNFMENNGSKWGARREVIQRATSAINEFNESAASLNLVQGSVRIDVSYDEFNIDVQINYKGQPMSFPDSRPTEASLLDDDNALVSLSGFMIRQYADQFRQQETNGCCYILLHFNH
ncbi:MAG: solute carrier family 23 protein [Ignavibacteriaceae bacterium]